MTAELAEQCEHAIHVITSTGSMLRAGRASLYIIDQVGWHRMARLLARRPFIWAVEAGYALVARNRGLFSRVLFRG